MFKRNLFITLLLGLLVFSLSPNVSYAQNMDNNGYDIEEEIDNSECDDETPSNESNGSGEGSGDTATGNSSGSGDTATEPTPAPASNASDSTNAASASVNSSDTSSTSPSGIIPTSSTGSYSGQSTNYKRHVLDNTPKTADISIDPHYALFSGLFFAGLYFIISSHKKDS